MEEVHQFLKDSGMYFLATVEGDQPRVRPFGTAEIFEGKLYIQTAKHKDVFSQIIANPKVEICAFKDGAWMRISGELELDDRVESKKDLLDKNPDLRDMYDENDDNTAMFFFKNAKATITSFTSEPKVIEF